MKKPQIHYLLHVVIIPLLLLCTFNAHSNDLSQQRWQFEQAYEAIQNKELENFQQFMLYLQDYPLYYYLRYHYLKPQLKHISSSEMQTFLAQYGDSHFGNSLRYQWLKQLARRGEWRTFLQFYTPQKSTSMQCYDVFARLITGQQVYKARQDAKDLWLVGKSQPKACDPVFNYLYEKDLISESLLWERIDLAMKKGRIRLTNAIAKHLEPNNKIWVTLWQRIHRQPEKVLTDFNEPDLPIVRKIILHGIRRLARKNFDLANEYWENFQRHYTFSVQQIGEMQRDLALISVKHDHPLALKWLTAVNKNYLNDKVSETRIKLALKRQNWRAVLDFITELPESERKNLQWRYWQARALEQTGKYRAARKIYQKLAKERDYYGFLAADRIGSNYQMQHNPIVFTPVEQAQVMRNISVQGAYEFYQLSKLTHERRWLYDARREWRYAIKHLPTHQQAIAAALASRWGWHDRAVMTAAKAGYYDDLDVRFPLPFYTYLATGALSQSIDLAWVYGIVRQESAFMSEARSRAGALGLMQLMPSTGRLVARKIGLKLKNTRDILEIENNVSLGTAYLRQMLDRFSGNHMLATAAYNAGPGRAKRWFKENGCLPPDIWVELIPFNETRNYVRRVLFYTRVFESRLGQRPRPLRVGFTPPDHCTFHYSGRDKDNSNTSG